MRRHDLMRATPDAWATMLADHPLVADQPLVRDWAGKGWPFIVRRFLDGEAAECVPGALPLPPSLGKRRLAFRFASAVGLTSFPPVRLDAVLPELPPAWRALAERLLDLDREHPPRVFGAVLWQHVTGLPYLSATSDLDLIWAPSNGEGMQAIVEGLRQLDKASTVRLDGEIELPDGSAVNWRELAGTDETDMVLVKSLHGVSMRPGSDLFAEASS